MIAAIIAPGVLIALTWLLSLRLHDASVIDPVWALAFVVLALAAAISAEGCPARRWVLFAMTAIWGLRLGWHLTRRKLADPVEDRRYAAMREAHPDHFALWSLGWVYVVQWLLVLVVALPILVAVGRDSRLSVLIAPGLVVYLLGLIFETVGDAQLRSFKADPSNGGAVLDRGLWRYTRHPNYFGDACVWWGIWLVALQAGDTWWTVIGPVVMTVLLVRVSGKSRLERDIVERRPGYADYVERTSGFIPMPPKRGERSDSD